MKIENNDKRLHHIGEEITLLPGKNDVDEKAWAKVAGLPVVKHYVEKGTIVPDDKKAKG